MNLTYHYNVIKTLAVHAGFAELDAQCVAHFSRKVDEFIMHAPVLLDRQPPDFFMEHGLARALRIRRNRWALLPCDTGINMLRTLSSGYRMHTLMPFHFIMPQPHYLLHKNAERSLYRCVNAGHARDLLINRLTNEAAAAAREAVDGTPAHHMALLTLGIRLHTFADTYSHEGFSGFQGWENAAIVRQGMRPAEAAFYSALPSIGHANAGTLPDEPAAVIDIHAKRGEQAPFASFIKRDNSVHFAECSRRILDILLRVKKNPPITDTQWEALKTKLTQAHITDAWDTIFPHVAYNYNRDEYIQIELEMLHHDEGVLEHLELEADALCDPHCEKSDRGRLSSITLARRVSDDFFHYNEAAYNQVLAATGMYASRSFHTQLETYCALAEEQGGV